MRDQQEKIRREQNLSVYYRDHHMYGIEQSICHLCGRRFPDTTIHMTGFLYFREKPRCLDEKDCRRYRRKHK